MLVAKYPVVDRGVIRVPLGVRLNGQLLYRDHVNLTSAKSRQRFCQELSNATAVDVPEKALLALEEAIQRQPQRVQHTIVDASPEVSEKVTSITELEARIEDYLLLEDPDVLEIVLAVVASHRLPGSPVWLFLVAPSSGVKTELLSLVFSAPGIYPLSQLTPRTFASGLTTNGGDDPSLLNRLKDDILVLKDFTSVLQMRSEDRQVILAQLREIYDGRYDQSWGTGKELHWEGRLGFLAGVTPVIDTHHGVMGLLGPRFVMFRIKQPDRQMQARRAMQNSGRDSAMRRKLAPLVAHFIRDLPASTPQASSADLNTLAQLADLVTSARSGVERDGYRRELLYAPEPEMPARLARQLLTLTQGLALVHQRPTICQEDLRKTIRVGLDSIPAVRRLTLGAFAKADSKLTTPQIMSAVQYAGATVRRALEDLQALGVIGCEKGGAGKADIWFLLDRWKALVATFPEISGTTPAAPPPSVSQNEHRAHCWKCKKPLPSNGDETCPICGRLPRCCMACASTCEGALDRRADVEEVASQIETVRLVEILEGEESLWQITRPDGSPKVGLFATLEAAADYASERGWRLEDRPT